MHKSRTSGPKNVAKSIRTFEDAVLSQPYVPVSEEGGQMLFKQRLLRALTCLDINFTLYSYFYLLEVPPKLAQKCTSMPLSDLKIGVIGCGAMGRLITNTLIVLSKCNHESNAEGLKTSNVAVSTRQTEHLSDYQHKYGVQVYYNNEQLMEQCDIVFICTPSTLDNWIMVDLKQSYQKRCAKQSVVRPLVFVLTTNTSEQKCRNVFTGCVLQPSMNYKSVTEFISANPNFEQEEGTNKIEILEKFAEERIHSNIPKLYNAMAYVFCNWNTTIASEEQIDVQAHEQLYNCFRKPSFEEVFKQRCKRWHSARMNFQPN